MARDRGYWSPEAIQSRQRAARDEWYRRNKEPKEPKEPKESVIQDPKQKTQPLTIQTDAGGFVPTPQNGEMEWDYKTSETDLQGRPLTSRNFFGINIKPKGFDPMGNPYFGGGFSGWLKKWGYKLSEEVADKEAADEAWDTFWDTAKDVKLGSASRVAANVASGEKELGEALAETGEQTSTFVQGVGQFFEAVGKSGESSKASSVLTPVLRGTNALVGMTLEGFQWVSELPEKAMGVNRAMREFANNAGSVLPDLSLDDDEGDIRVGEYNDAANFATRIFNPLLAGYDSLRFWTSPGTVDEKLEAVKGGWTEGQMLYTELVKPAVREEYLQRVMAGEDGNLLAMELQDPWIEMAGEIILDPLNMVGAFGKMKKAGSTIAEASRVVSKTGLLNDVDVVNDLKRIGRVSTDAEATQIMSRLETKIIEAASDAGRRVDAAQSWKIKDFLPSGNRFRYHRTVGNFLSNATQTIRQSGGELDDVMDYVVALVKRASGEPTAVRESIAALSHSPLQTLSYNQAAFDTGYILNKIIGDGESLVKAVQRTGGDWNEMRKILDDRIVKALDFAFPDVSDMKKAADKVQELAKTGQAADAKTSALAERFTQLQKTNPGAVKQAAVQDFVKKFLRPINGFLANNYFSLSYGYAFRNLVQNFFTLWIDDGFVFGGGKFPPTTKLDDFLVKQFGEIPVSLRGKTLTKSLTEGSLAQQFFNKLNAWKYSPAAFADWGETYAGKMIFIKKYRETMDSALKFGAAVPDMATWNKAGFTTQQAMDYVNILKSSAYNADEALEVFARKYGSGVVDKWRQLDWVEPNVQKGLEEYEGFWGRIVQLTNKEDVTQSEVLNLIDDLKVQVRRNAHKVNSEPVRLDMSDPSWASMADEVEFAGKHVPPGYHNGEAALKIKFSEAATNFNEALRVAASKLPPEAASLRDEIMEFIDPQNINRISVKVEQQADELRFWAVDIRNSKKPVVALWDESLLGKMPTAPTKNDLMAAVWDNFFKRKRELYEKKWALYTQKAQDLAGKTGLHELFGKAQKSLLELEQYRNYTYNGKGIFAKPPVFQAAEVGTAANGSNVRRIANAYGIPTASKAGKNADKKLLNIINKYSEGGFSKLDDVPPNIAEQAIAKHEGYEPVKFFDANGAPRKVEEGVPVPPPRDPVTAPAGHVYSEVKQGTLDALDYMRKGILERWGLKAKGSGDMEAFRVLTSEVRDRVSVARAQSTIVAEKWRDFALLPYGETTNLDFAMSLIYPYQFWYSRSYKNWMVRAFQTNPEVISRYANLKDALSNDKKGMPDWWKSQIEITKPLEWAGIDVKNPVYINAEATLWPLYGLTGTDFNDPMKRTNWFTSLVDDAGKFGPSMWAPIQWGIAAYYHMKGEKEIASKWGGRAIPQTATFKAVSSWFGTPIETDPAVQMFSGDGLLDFRASDPYEEGRIARALAAMEAEGIPQEQLIEAMRTQSGDLWNEAYQRAVRGRSLGQLSSFFFGVGFKARSREDVEIDTFYSDYFRLKNLFEGEQITKEQYQDGFNTLRERYPFMDLILLSRRAGDGREAAYAYNVMSRIPPGASSDILEAAGIDPKTAQKFYDSGGKLDALSETERARFLAGMTDVGAILAIPSNATRKEWTAARQNYADMNEQLQLALGDDILEKIDAYYAISDKGKARLYMESHPEIQEAFDLKNQLIVEDPLLMKYYGGVDVLERFHKNQMYDQLEKEFGKEITDLEQQYYSLDPAAKRQFKREHPELNSYFDRKAELKEEVLRKLVEFGEMIDPRPEAREDVEPVNPAQEDILEATQAEPQISFDQWQEVLGEPLVEQIVDFYNDEGDLSYYATKELDYQAGRLGIDRDELLRRVLVSLQNNVVQSQP